MRKTQKATHSTCRTSNPKQPVFSGCQHMRKPQEVPHTVRVRSVIPIAKIRESRGHIPEDNFQNRTASGRLPIRTSFQNFVCCRFETTTPIKVVTSPLAMLQRWGAGGERREGLCMDHSHHSYSFVCLRLMGWGGGQTPSTF